MNGKEPINIGYPTIPEINNLTHALHKNDMTELSEKISDRLPKTIAALIK